MMETLSFKLETFEGPLDLLLHLINKNKMDICSVSLTVVTEQFLQYITQMEQMDIEMSGDFLVVAAQLLLIKSRSLLPKKQEEDEEDPGEQLAERLKEYQKFKHISEQLSQMAGADDYSYVKPPSFIEPAVEDNRMGSVSMDKLFRAFMLVYSKKTNENNGLNRDVFENITNRVRVSVFSKVKHILRLIREQQSLGFYEFFMQMQSKSEMVAGFLAILELLKLNRIDISESDDEIVMRMAKV